MNPADIRQQLESILSLRVPLLDPNSGGGAKIAALEDYLSKAAHHRGVLEECMYWLTSARVHLRREWDAIEGWQAMLGGRDRTQAKIDEAKAKLKPDVRMGLAEADELIAAVDRQIRRLELDERTTSRLYSLITGST